MKPVENFEDVLRNAPPRNGMVAAIDVDGVDFGLGLGSRAWSAECGSWLLVVFLIGCREWSVGCGSWR
jgi:hypothetical protein